MTDDSETSTQTSVRPRIRLCPECGGSKLMRDYEAAEIVCEACGYVIAEKLIDSRPEWRAFDDEQRAKRTRVGAPLTYTIHDKGLSTIIDWRDKRTGGKSLTPAERLDLYKLRKWQRRVRVSDSTERNLAVALSEMSKLSSGLNLPKNILETASVIYRRAIRKKLIRGRSIHNVTAAAIYMSCRQCGVARTLDEIAASSNLNKKDIGRSYRFMVRELETFVPPSTSHHYAARFSNKLAISGKAEAIALKILEIAKGMKLTSGRGPTGIAAAATYVATVLTNERRTQREIAEVANVTEVTIRNRYKELLERLFIEVPL
ncbi:transcription initiation factor IIB [Candidatus Bathyarchaeota archaeon]|nr:transcription initiation factor IIB [Candidatus Bathyarchaeota archaeon]